MAKYHLCPKYLAIYYCLQNIKQSSTVQQLIITITSSRFLNHWSTLAKKMGYVM